MTDPKPEVQTEWDVFAEEIWAAPVQCWAEMIEERVRAAVAAERDDLLDLWEIKCEAIREAVKHLVSVINSDLAEFIPGDEKSADTPAPDPSAAGGVVYDSVVDATREAIREVSRSPSTAAPEPNADEEREMEK